MSTHFFGIPHLVKLASVAKIPLVKVSLQKRPRLGCHSLSQQGVGRFRVRQANQCSGVGESCMSDPDRYGKIN